MKFIKSLFACVIISCSVNAMSGENLLKDGGFESASREKSKLWIKGWDWGNLSDGASIDKNERHSWNASLKITGNGIFTIYWPVGKNDYVFSCWTKNNDPIQTKIAIVYINPETGKLERFPGEGKISDKENNGWQKLEVIIEKRQLPEKLKTLGIKIDIPKENKCVYLDDFSLVSLDSGKNILSNPSFEEEYNSYQVLGENPEWKTESWAYHGIPRQNSRIDNSTRHSGNSSLKLDGGKNVVSVCSNVKQIEKGKTYKLSGWIKCSYLNAGKIDFGTWEKNEHGWKRMKESVNPVLFCTTKDWFQVETFFEVPPDSNCNGLSVRILLPGNNSGEAWFDDFSLIETDKKNISPSGNFLINADFKRCTNPRLPDWWSPVWQPQLRIGDWSIENFGIDETVKSPVPNTNVLKLFDPQKSEKPFTFESNPLSIKMHPGVYTFSAYLKSDQDALQVKYLDYHSQKSETFTVGKEWKRFTYTSNRSKGNISRNHSWLSFHGPATLWMAAPQFEAGDKATDFKPSKLDDILSIQEPVSAKQEENIISTVCERQENGPEIDGVLDDSFWRKATSLSEFVPVGNDAKDGVNSTKAFVGRDSENLYVGVICNSPGITNTKANTENPWKGDTIELFVSPDADAERYCHFVCNSNGAMFSEMGSNGPSSFRKPWTVKTKAEKDQWCCEFKIPFSNLPFYTISDIWRLNVCRSREIPGSTKRENSSWAKILAGFHSPSSFGKMKMTCTDDLKEKGWRVDSLCSEPGKNTLSLWITGQSDNTENARAELIVNGNTYQGRIDKTGIGNGKNRQFTFSGLPADIKGLPIELLIFNPKNKILKRMDVDRSSADHYAIGNGTKILAEFSLYTTEKEARIFIENSGKKPFSGVIVLKDEKSTELFRQKFEAIPGSKKIVPLNIEKLEAGSYELVLYDEYLNSPVYCDVLRKVAPNKVLARYNKITHIIELNGKPLYIVPFIGAPKSKRELEIIKEAGFNTVAFFGTGDVPEGNRFAPRAKGWAERTRKYLDFLSENGFMVFLRFSSKFSFPYGKKEGSFDAYTDCVLEVIRELKDHPAIIGWNGEDEQSEETWEKEKGFKEHDMVKLYNAIKKEAPYHLIWTNWCSASKSTEMYGSLDCTDIISLDTYPFMYNNFPLSLKPFEKFISFISVLNYYEKIRNKPTALYYQIYGFGDAGREPTPSECMAQHYIALAYGITFVAQFAGRPFNNSTWEKIGTLNKQGKIIFDEIFANPATENLKTGVSIGDFHYSVWKKKNKYFIIIVNSSYAQSLLSLNINSMFNFIPSRTTLMFESQNIKINNGILVDKFKPLEAKIYVMEK